MEKLSKSYLFLTVWASTREKEDKEKQRWAGPGPLSWSAHCIFVAEGGFRYVTVLYPDVQVSNHSTQPPNYWWHARANIRAINNLPIKKSS